jgi:hypothetical protein
VCVAALGSRAWNEDLDAGDGDGDGDDEDGEFRGEPLRPEMTSSSRERPVNNGIAKPWRIGSLCEQVARCSVAVSMLISLGVAA